MQTEQQHQQLPFTEQNPEVARKDLMKAHFVNAQYWADRVPHMDGANKRAAARACMGALKQMLAVCKS